MKIELDGQMVDLDDLKSGYFHMDCMEGMKKFPDKYFDLAVVDPPYGININANMGVRKKFNRKVVYPKATWDNKPPDKSYFDELFRVANKVVIWGGNYFELPPAKCFLIYRKTQISEDMDFSMVEYAWTNLDGTAKEFIYSSNNHNRHHPTEKPVALYRWIFDRYAKRGQKFLDTHVGSASSLIAAHDAGLIYIGFELDDYYYKVSKERLDNHTAQMSIFDLPESTHNESDDGEQMKLDI